MATTPRPPTPPTTTGRPRSEGLSRCSTAAKNASRSRCRMPAYRRIPHPPGPAFQIDFDFVASELVLTTVAGEERGLSLRPRPVADFYAEVMRLLEELGVGTEIWPVPVEIPDAIPFPDDHVHSAYD